MSCEITLIYPFRDRELYRIKKSLDSLIKQTNKEFTVFFVDYGSKLEFSKEVKQLVESYSFTKYVYSYTSEQLWNKARAINIALNNAKSPYCFIADVDMFYKENFIEKLFNLREPNKVLYFQVGFLNSKESIKNISFNSYKLINKSQKGATGLTLFNTQKLKDIRGFDEFYHFWGSEDTDAHTRMKNAGSVIKYFDKELLMLHQYHPSFQQIESKKQLKSLIPENIVKINYINQLFNEKEKVLKVNKTEMGQIISKKEYNSLQNNIDITFEVFNKKEEVDYYLNEVLNNTKDQIIQLYFKEVKTKNSNLKSTLKKILKTDINRYYSLYEINTLIVKKLIFKYRHNLYSYTINKDLDLLTLTIKL